MRTYTWIASGGRRRGFDFWPDRDCQSNLRIRAVAVLLFRKWFGGREPSFSWHKDGMMAEAHDKSGRVMQVTQFNHGAKR